FMTATKNNSIFKKLGALAMAMCLTCALAVSASAATVVDGDTSTYSVTICKGNGSDISLANDDIADDAVVSTRENGSIEVVIPIVPLYDYTAMGVFTADGYLTAVDVEGANGSVIATSANTGDRVNVPYATAELVITADAMPSDGRFVVSNSEIELYN